MRRLYFILLLGLQAALCFSTDAVAQTITNVTADQRQDDSGLVDISYRLSDASEPMTVSVRVSPDGGATWQVVSSVTGDVGAGIANGTRAIVWNAGVDVPDIHWSSAQIQVTATVEISNTLVVNVTPDTAQWTLSGPSGFEGNGQTYIGDREFADVPVGDYTWTGLDNVSGYDPPAD